MYQMTERCASTGYTRAVGKIIGDQSIEIADELTQVCGWVYLAAKRLPRAGERGDGL